MHSCPWVPSELSSAWFRHRQSVNVHSCPTVASPGDESPAEEGALALHLQEDLLPNEGVAHAASPTLQDVGAVGSKRQVQDTPLVAESC